jgi:hypothetical protein
MKLISLMLIFVSLFLFVSCGMSEDEFETEYPKTICEKGKECGDVTDVSTCREGMKSDMELIMIFCSGYDPDNAEDCVNCMGNLSCSEWNTWQAEEEGEETICTKCNKVCN